MEKCIFIGYPEGYKGWKFYNPEIKKVVICERAEFNERYSYLEKLLKREVEDKDSALRPLIPIEQEPASVVLSETELVEQPVENFIPEPQSEIPDLPQPAIIAENDDEQSIAIRRTRKEIKPPGEW